MENKCEYLIVGDGSCKNLHIYEDALYEGFLKCGKTNTVLLTYDDCYLSSNSFFLKKINNFQSKYLLGPIIDKINKKIFDACIKYKPKFVFLYRVRELKPKTIKKIKELGIYIIVYNNDDAFSNNKNRHISWRYFISSLKYSDLAFAYRNKNIEDFESVGCKNVKLLLPYYTENRNYYIDTLKGHNDKHVPDVVFLGHIEADERLEYLKIISENGIEIGLSNGYEYEKYFGNNKNIVYLDSMGENYNIVLNKTKIALVFLSKLNSDKYTRRCFEIPPTKTLMIAPYNDEIVKLFEPNKEVIYYRTVDDIVEAIKYYLEHEDKRMEIVDKCYQRIMHDGHSNVDRARQIIDISLNEVKG